MAGEFVVLVEGLKGVDAAFGDLSRKTKLNARRAINAATARARTDAAREIGRQVNFPAQYLAPAGGRLAVSKFATDSDLEGRVKATDRATSLARFALGSGPVAPKGSRPIGVSVEVKPGLARFMTGAFLIRLRAGAALTDTKNNLGLAIRLRGHPIANKKFQVKAFGNGLYLLYGPSVAQVFGGDTGVAQEVSDPTAEFLKQEFERLMGADV